MVDGCQLQLIANTATLDKCQMSIGSSTEAPEPAAIVTLKYNSSLHESYHLYIL